MFCSGSIGRSLAVDAYNVLALVEKGLIKDVIKGQLEKIKHHRFAFDTDSSNIQLYSGEHSEIRLKLIEANQLTSAQSIYTQPSETFIYPLGGEVRLTQYTLSDNGEVVDSKSWDMAQEIHFFGKTSDTLQCYDLQSVSDSAMLLIGAGTSQPDDVYFAYDKDRLIRTGIISNNITESRIEYWMTFFSELDITSDRAIVQQLVEQAASRKFKAYLADNLGEDGGGRDGSAPGN